jgi:hypothetical protein
MDRNKQSFVILINHGRVVRRKSRSLFSFFPDRFLVLDFIFGVSGLAI